MINRSKKKIESEHRLDLSHKLLHDFTTEPTILLKERLALLLMDKFPTLQLWE